MPVLVYQREGKNRSLTDAPNKPHQPDKARGSGMSTISTKSQYLNGLLECSQANGLSASSSAITTTDFTSNNIDSSQQLEMTKEQTSESTAYLDNAAQNWKSLNNGDTNFKVDLLQHLDQPVNDHVVDTFDEVVLFGDQTDEEASEGQSITEQAHPELHSTSDCGASFVSPAQCTLNSGVDNTSESSVNLIELKIEGFQEHEQQTLELDLPSDSSHSSGAQESETETSELGLEQRDFPTDGEFSKLAYVRYGGIQMEGNDRCNYMTDYQNIPNSNVITSRDTLQTQYNMCTDLDERSISLVMFDVDDPLNYS